MWIIALLVHNLLKDVDDRSNQHFLDMLEREEEEEAGERMTSAVSCLKIPISKSK
jgi:hypothetical protein